MTSISKVTASEMAAVMNTETPGIDWRGCSKTHLLESLAYIKNGGCKYKTPREKYGKILRKLLNIQHFKETPEDRDWETL